MTESNANNGMTRRNLIKWGAAAGLAGVAGYTGWRLMQVPSADQPIKIGIVSQLAGPPFSGLTADISNGLNLALQQAGNEVAGRKFELVEADTQVKPAEGIDATRKVIQRDNVDFLMGPISSAVAAAMRSEVVNSDVLWLISNAGNVILTSDQCAPNIFRTSFSSWQTAYPFGPWAYENVAQDYFLAYSNFAFGQQSAQFFTESFTAAGGNILGEVTPPLGTSDFSSFITPIQEADTPAVFAFFSGSDAIAFVKQFAEFGLNAQIALTGNGFMVEEDVLDAQGEAALGVRTLLFWALNLDTPNNNSFRSAYEESFDERPSVFSVQGYDTGNVIVDVVKRLDGKVNNLEEVIKATEATNLTNSPRGPQLRFDPVTHNVILNMYVREVQQVDGRYTNIVIDDLGEAIQPPMGCDMG